MAFDFNRQAQRALSTVFNQVQGKTWKTIVGENITIDKNNFYHVFGECLAEAINNDSSWTTDDELGDAACTFMKKKLGL